MFFPNGERGLDSFHEKVAIDFDALRREDAHLDFGFGIVKADAKKTLAMIFDLHHFAIGGGRGQAQNGAGVNPGMAGEDAVGFSGANKDSWQSNHFYFCKQLPTLDCFHAAKSKRVSSLSVGFFLSTEFWDTPRKHELPNRFSLTSFSREILKDRGVTITHLALFFSRLEYEHSNVLHPGSEKHFVADSFCGDRKSFFARQRAGDQDDGRPDYY